MLRPRFRHLAPSPALNCHPTPMWTPRRWRRGTFRPPWRTGEREGELLLLFDAFLSPSSPTPCLCLLQLPLHPLIRSLTSTSTSPIRSFTNFNFSPRPYALRRYRRWKLAGGDITVVARTTVHAVQRKGACVIGYTRMLCVYRTRGAEERSVAYRSSVKLACR